MNNTDFTFKNDCLVTSSTASWLSQVDRLKLSAALYVEAVHYLKFVKMTFGGMSLGTRLDLAC